LLSLTVSLTEGATGLTNLDARWYNPYSQRFVQPDYWSFQNTGLPLEIQHELLRFSRLDTTKLLSDPSQQLAYGYVAGNALAWNDQMGLGRWKDLKDGVKKRYNKYKAKRLKKKNDKKRKKALKKFRKSLVKGSNEEISNLDELRIAFDGAGGEFAGNNAEFNKWAKENGFISFDEGAFSGHKNGNIAVELISAFKEINPNGKVYVAGYSAGGDEAVWVENQASNAGISIDGLATFDPHKDSMIGFKNYENFSAKKAVNAYQQNPAELGPNTFRGSPVNNSANLNIGPSNHNNIFKYVNKNEKGVLNYAMDL